VEVSQIANKASISRRTAIGGAVVGLSTLALSGRAVAQEAVGQEKDAHKVSFVLLLKGLYQPVVHGPNLGLSTVNLSDGSYQTTKIYLVHGFPGNEGIPGDRRQNWAVGDFYVQPAGTLCAYHVPGGAFSMQFTGNDTHFVDDGQGGRFLEGTFELTILEATGLYRRLVGGHNHMVDKLHFLAPGDGSGGLDEYCFCFISGP
jgi:hypothetical protein